MALPNQIEQFEQQLRTHLQTISGQVVRFLDLYQTGVLSEEDCHQCLMSLLESVAWTAAGLRDMIRTETALQAVAQRPNLTYHPASTPRESVEDELRRFTTVTTPVPEGGTHEG